MSMLDCVSVHAIAYASRGKIVKTSASLYVFVQVEVGEQGS